MVAKNTNRLDYRLYLLLYHRSFEGTITRKEILSAPGLMAHRAVDKAIERFIGYGILEPLEPQRTAERGRPAKRYRIQPPGKRFNEAMDKAIRLQATPMVALKTLRVGMRRGTIKSWDLGPFKPEANEVFKSFMRYPDSESFAQITMRPYFITAPSHYGGRPGLLGTDLPKGFKIDPEEQELADLIEQSLAQAVTGLAVLRHHGWDVPMIVLPFMLPDYPFGSPGPSRP